MTSHKKIYCCLAAAVLISASALARPAAAGGDQTSAGIRGVNDGVNDRALQLQLNADGLTVIADVVKSQLLPKSSTLPLPDSQDELSGGIQVELSDMQAAVEFDQLLLTPEAGALHVDLGLKSLEIADGQLRLYKNVLGGKISTTCHDTVLKFGKSDLQHLKAGITGTVRDGSVVLDVNEAHFNIAADNYAVDGPARCSGKIGVGNLTEALVHSILRSARPFIEKAVIDKIHAVVPALAKELNAQTHRSFDFAITHQPPLPDRQAKVETLPSTMTIDQRGLLFELGAAVEDTSNTDGHAASQGMGEPAPTPLGSIGVNPEILSNVFATLYPNGSDFVELSDDTVSGLKDVLNTQSAAAIWPDLNEIEKGASYLRLFVRLVGTPEFYADDNTQSIGLVVPRLELRFMVQHGGQWQDYFVMGMQIQGGIRAKIADGNLTIGLQSEPVVALDGHWAPGYTPVNARFEEDVAEFLFSSLFDFLYAQGPLIHMWVPVVPVAEHWLSLARPHTGYPFFALDLVEIPRNGG